MQGPNRSIAGATFQLKHLQEHFATYFPSIDLKAQDDASSCLFIMLQQLRLPVSLGGADFNL